jgi:hypothetical protein
MDPLALMGVNEDCEERVSEERNQRESEEHEGSGAKRFHANHHTSTAPIGRFL